MTPLRIGFLLSTAAVAIAACHDEAPAESSPTPTAGVGDEGSTGLAALLRDFRARLDELRAMDPPDEAVNRGGDLDVTPIVGMSRADIRSALGEPSTCVDNPVMDQDGNRRPVAPCQTNDDWFYSFYRLPEQWVGGGPELLLTFDAAGVCTAADWRFTQ